MFCLLLSYACACAFGFDLILGNVYVYLSFSLDACCSTLYYRLVIEAMKIFAGILKFNHNRHSYVRSRVSIRHYVELLYRYTDTEAMRLNKQEYQTPSSTANSP